MYKQSPSRGHRSKGIKVKHVLQVCLLLAVCFWLIYQVKHSQDKRREFDAKDEKVVDKIQTDNEILKLGRKDLPRDTETVTVGDKHVEDEEEKDTEEEEEENKPEEEENKHEEDEPEREDGKTGERKEEKGSGDDETDENEPEKKEAEHEHGDEQVDGDQENEDNEEDAEDNHAENEEKEFPGKDEHFEAEEDEDARKDHSEPEDTRDVGTDDHNERDATSDDQDRDGDNADTHEAQEELYKADDASSEVAHHVQNINPETENVTEGHASDMFGKVNFGLENETRSSDNPNTLITTDVEPREDRDEISNETSIEQNKDENNLTKSDGGAFQNSTSGVLPNNEAEMRSNSTSLDREYPALSNRTHTVYDANVSLNANVENVTVNKDSNLLGNVLGDSDKPKLGSDELSEASGNLNKPDTADSKVGDSLSSSNTTVDSQKLKDTDASGAAKDSIASDKNLDEKVENNEADESDESSSSHSSAESEGAIQHDPIDASDINVSEEEKDSSMDMDELPEIRTEVGNAEEAMAE